MDKLSNGTPNNMELEKYTTEVLTDMLQEAVGRKDYSVVGKISRILEERSDSPQGPSSNKVPRLEIIAVVENKTGKPSALVIY